MSEFKVESTKSYIEVNNGSVETCDVAGCSLPAVHRIMFRLYGIENTVGNILTHVDFCRKHFIGQVMLDYPGPEQEPVAVAKLANP